MKKTTSLFVFFFIIGSLSFAQQGVWTWMHGSNVQNPVPGTYGTKGAPSPTNVPPVTYEGSEWTDLNGKFWYYGGTGNNPSALWMYDPVTNMWTWMNGPNTLGTPAVFGTKGVPSALNCPGPKQTGACTWVDQQGDLWLFGGNPSGGRNSVMWRYNIASNMWTWMNGPNGLTGNMGSYGTQNVSSPTNYPPDRDEGNASWVDNAGNLWMFGGADINNGFMHYNDLWKYNIATNEWTWVRGANTFNAPGSVGTIGVASPTNDPPAGFMTYSKWKDKNGDFWLMGGGRSTTVPYSSNQLWKYTVATNQWTCIRQHGQEVKSAACVFNANNLPEYRIEGRVCWTDACGNFWLFGGSSTNYGEINDLWCYDPVKNEWAYISGGVTAASYGAKGVPNASNHPPRLMGAVPFKHNDGSFWLFGGATYNAMWRYVIDTNCVPCRLPQPPIAGFNGTNLSGCDSLTVSFTDTSSGNPTSWNWNFGDGGTSTMQNPVHTYVGPGQYTVTLIASNANGSDTATYVNYVTVFPAAVAAFTASNNTLCINQSVTFANTSTNANSYLWSFGNGNTSTSTNPSTTYTTPGTYIVSLIAQNANNCNDTITMPIHVVPNFTNNQNANICSGNSYTLPSGTVVTTSGIYHDTLSSIHGCDSIINTNVTVSSIITTNQNSFICAGTNYVLPGGTIVTAAGTYSDTLSAQGGCDSVITTVLTVNPIVTINQSGSICAGSSYVLPGGNSVSAAGMYMDTLTTSKGCDSIITTTLSIIPISQHTQNIAICAGTSFALPGGTIVNTAGSYIDTLLSIAGCDSIVTTVLVVNPLSVNAQSITICIGSSYVLPGGNAVSAAGIYVDTLTASNGCDSIVTTTLSLVSAIQNIQNVSVCIGNTFTLPDGSTVSTAGTYIDTLIAQGGCDSIIITVLVVNPAVTSNQAINICAGSSYMLPGGNTITTAGIYYDTLTSSKGCDSVITTTISVNPNSVSNQSQTICFGNSFTLPDGSITTLAGVYKDTITSYNGCDSIITTTLIVNPLPTASVNSNVTIQQGESTILTATGGGTYSWTPTTDLSPTTGNTVTASPSRTTTYCVVVTDNKGCTDSACVTIMVSELPCQFNENIELPNAFSPNNDAVNDDYCLQGWDVCIENFNIFIYDRWGEKVFESKDPNFCWDGKYKGTVMDSQVFVYYIKAKYKNEEKSIVKTGNISLIR